MFELGGWTTLLLVIMLLASSVRILREYHRGVVFMLGRFWKVKGPGLILIIPGIQQMVRVDLRTVVFDDVATRSNRNGHTRWPRSLNARHRQRDTGLPRTNCDLRLTSGRTRCKRWNLHPLC